ncbi:hypothetical protein [Mycolicibacterium stellerae]|uniref:hypothetical protein n=1 Tax=Mycolicibacterium stellerae TaxID=2358193 RepID=UPI0013DD9631|nr:hypothetical protein [Mycolicibacterium stellerae]
MTACIALIVGPSLVGTAVAKADLLGVGGGGGGIDVLGIDLLGGGGKAKTVNGGRARLDAVSTAPSARSVVIRSRGPAAVPVAQTAPAPAIVSAAYAPATMMGSPLVEAIPAASPPAALPPAAVPQAAGLIAPPAAPAYGPPAPRALPVIPSTSAPWPGRPLAPGDSLRPPTKIPAGFRAGYAEYLRSATNMDILAAALPGAVGIAGFTLIGAFAGYRQAKGVQRALLAPVPTRILL